MLKHVEKPYTPSLKELEEMKDTTEFVTFECIGKLFGSTFPDGAKGIHSVSVTVVKQA